MSSEALFRRGLPALLLILLLGGCAELQGRLCRGAGPSGGRVDQSAGLLAYHARLASLSSQDLDWEQMLLAAEPLGPEGRIRLAMVLAQETSGSDFERALALLEPVFGSDLAEAAELRPLAGLLAAYYRDRRRDSVATDRLGQEVARLNQQVRVAQLRAEMLQQKLDALADIERSLPVRPADKDMNR